MSKVDTKHPDWLRLKPEWLTMRHVEEGSTRVKGEGTMYLPRPGGFEAQQDGGKAMYASYNARAQFPDIVNPTLQGMVGLIHRKEPQIELPDSLMYIWEKATRDGLTLEALFRRITAEVMLTGRLAVLADASAAGSDPWLALYSAESLINWDTDRSFFVFDESGLRREGFEWKERKEYRELYLEGGEYRVRTYGEGLEATGTSTPLMRGDRGLTEIPLVIIGPTDLAVEPSVPPLLGVANSALAIYRLDADYRHQLFMSGQETLIFTGIENPDSLPKFVGAGVIHGLPPNADAKYVGPNCKGIEAHERAIANERSNAVAAGARFFEDSTPDRESGKAKSLRFAAEMATLTSISISSAAGLEKALRYCAIMLGADPEKVIVKPNLEFFDSKLAAQEVVNLVTSWQQGAFSYQTLYENMQRGGIASEERSVEEELALVKTEVEERERKARELLASQQPKPVEGGNEE